MTEIDRRKFLILGLVSLLSVPLTGCLDDFEGMTIEDLIELLNERAEEDSEDSDEETSGPVTLALTYPAGRSPNVFTSGWVFGARCIANIGTDDEKDISSAVKWSGSGNFNPDKGNISRPVFSSTGMNMITISVSFDGKDYEKTVMVNAVNPGGYARVGGLAKCPSDSHGCPACPHTTIGPIISGSPNVLINGKPAARVGDKGTHAACCGPNTFTITSGDSSVLINGRAAVIKGSFTQHCGGTGSIISLT